MAPKASKSNGGDSKQGLVITLVLFILITIGLGISTYTGYTADEGKSNQIKEKDKEIKITAKDRDWWKLQALLFKAYMGHQAKEEVEDLKVLKDKFDQGTEPAWESRPCGAARDDHEHREEAGNGMGKRPEPARAEVEISLRGTPGGSAAGV